MSRVYMIADLHFGHENIIKYEDRPFENVLDMDWTMVGRWDGMVSERDRIFVLGDFSFYNREKTTNILKGLHGHKTLILGNHDTARTISWWKDVGFNEVIKYPIIYDEFYILSHEPVYLNSHMPYVNIHGHIHSKRLSLSQYYNVSVEHTNYAPVDFEEIKAFYRGTNDDNPS